MDESRKQGGYSPLDEPFENKRRGDSLTLERMLEKFET